MLLVHSILYRREWIWELLCNDDSCLMQSYVSVCIIHSGMAYAIHTHILKIMLWITCHKMWTELQPWSRYKVFRNVWECGWTMRVEMTCRRCGSPIPYHHQASTHTHKKVISFLVWSFIVFDRLTVKCRFVAWQRGFQKRRSADCLCVLINSVLLNLLCVWVLF